MKEQLGTSRLDKIVEAAGEKMAGGYTRRGFLGRVAGVAGATLLGGAVVLGEKSETRADQCASGCFSQNQVNVCYSPWRVTRSWSGLSGIPIFKGPSQSSPMLSISGSIVTIPVNEVFGRCSNRTAASCADPGPRSSVSLNGQFLWGYRQYGFVRIGWIPYRVNGVTYCVGDNGATTTLCGPAGVDFDCRRAKSYCPSYNGCSGGGEVGTTSSDCYKSVLDGGSEDQNSSTGYLVKYAPNSCGTYWLDHANDKVHQFCYTGTIGAWSWSCFSAVRCDWMPQGCRGWVGREKLSGSIAKPACGGNTSMPCMSVSYACS